MASLLSLPVEMISHIIDGISPTDLINLRTTCREIAAKTHDSFIKVHFKTKCFLISSKAAMSTLLQISEDRVFARAVQRIEFLSTRLAEMDARLLTRLAAEKSSALSMSETEQDAYTIECQSTYAALREEEETFVSEERLQMLTAILRNFRRAYSYPSIGVISAPSSLTISSLSRDSQRHTELAAFLEEFRPWGYRALTKAHNTSAHSHMSRALGQEHELPQSQQRRRDYAHVYQAIMHSHFPVRRLSLGQPDVPLNMSEFTYRRGAFRMIYLRSLRLTLCCGNCSAPRNRDVFSRAGLSAFVDLLVHARNLVHLKLRLDSDVRWSETKDSRTYGNLFHCLANKVFPDNTPIELEIGAQIVPKLKTLRLTGFNFVDLETVLSFLGERKDTLTAVTLEDVYAHGRATSWRIGRVKLEDEADRVGRAIKEVVGADEKPDFVLDLKRVYFREWA